MKTAEQHILDATIAPRDGYISDNPLTILADVLRKRAITAEQYAIAAIHMFTDAEVANVVASLAAGGHKVECA